MANFRDTATGAAALNKSTDALAGGEALIEVRIHLDAPSATAENLVVSIDSGLGATYDQILATQDMNTLADYRYAPSVPVPLFAGDIIKVAWGNTNTKTYGLEIIWQK